MASPGFVRRRHPSLPDGTVVGVPIDADGHSGGEGESHAVELEAWDIVVGAGCASVAVCAAKGLGEPVVDPDAV
jgi:hypothetical protein